MALITGSNKKAKFLQRGKTRKWPYLTWFSSKLKNKTTLFSSTLKVREKKVVLVFHFEQKWPSCGHFHISQNMISETKNQKSRKWPYLAHFSSKWKNKTTLFSSTLKVGEKKVVLFFHFEQKWPSYGHFHVSLHMIPKTKN